MPHVDEQTTDEQTPEEPDPREVNKQAQKIVKVLLPLSEETRKYVLEAAMLPFGLIVMNQAKLTSIVHRAIQDFKNDSAPE